MIRIRSGLFLGVGVLVLFGIVAAQTPTPVTTIGGAAGKVAKFSDTSSLVDSAITEVNGNVGIGTTAPVGLLDVYGNASFGASTFGKFQITTGGASPISNRLVFGTDNTGWKMAISKNNSGTVTDLMTFQDNGNVGVGTTGPSAPLEISTPASPPLLNPPVIKVVRTGGNVFGEGPALEFDDYNNGGAQGHIYTFLTFFGLSGNTTGKLILGSHGNSANTGTTFNDELTLFSGNVGIGTTAPAAKLEVAGNVKLSGGGSSVTFPDNSIQSTAWNGTLCGGDYAESVDVNGDRAAYGPGDVLTIDPDHPGKFLKSTEPYSTTVLGVYSTKPGAVGRRQATLKSTDEVPMAMVGIVPTKVSAENGPIRPGDLLVSSSIPGYAMKGTDRTRMLGAVIGKALGRLESGTGVIEVGVTLQ